MGLTGFRPNFSVYLDYRLQILLCILKINSHLDGAGDLYPAAGLPEFTAARIIVGHHDNDALDPGPAQTLQAFIQQTLTESASLISRINRQMINVPTASIVTA